MKVREDHLQINGVDIGYTHLGDGEKSLIIIQGWKNWWEAFTKEILLSEIEKANLQVFAFDTPQWDTSRGYFNTLEEFCSLIKKAIDRLDLPKASICGQSRGAVIALLFGATYPEKVERIVLASPPATLLKHRWGRRLGKHLIHFARETPLLLKILNLIQKNYWFSLLTVKTTTLYHFDKKLFDTHIYPAALQCNLRVGLLNDESASDVNWEDILANTSHEVAIITGEKDPVSMISDCRKLQKVLPAGTKLFVIPETKHGIMMEKPREFAKLIVDFVSA